MLHVHRSEDAATLVGALAEVLASPAINPLTPEVVAVPTSGIERWIAQELALRLGAAEGADGVAANIEFPPLGRLVMQALAVTFANASADAWSEDQLVWPVLAAIDASLDEAWMNVVARFVRGSGQVAIEGRRMEAALRVAALFASYDRECPDMIRSWAEGEDSGPDEAPLDEAWAWQPRLWRLVRTRVGCPSLAESLDQALDHLAAGEVTVQLPPRVCVYGVTAVPIGHLQVLAALARHREVYLFVLHPSQPLWESVGKWPVQPGTPHLRSEDPTAWLVDNPLLRSWGRDVREVQVLLALCQIPMGKDHPYSETAPVSLLRRLQRDIRANRPPPGPPAKGEEDARPELDPADRSLQIHACHGPTRQAEVLRDEILHTLAADPTLEPRDILVMCPDVERYAPLIEAAFRPDPSPTATDLEKADRTTIPAGIPDVRVRIADRAPYTTNPLARLVVLLISLAGSRLTAGAVLDFAALGPVRRRFRLDDDLVDAMTELVANMQVSWGLDADHRAGHGLPGRPERTWKEGLERLLAGVMAADRQVELIGPRLPVPGIEGEELHAVDRLAELVSRIAAFVQLASSPMPAQEWRQELTSAVMALGDTGPGEDWQWPALERQFDRFFGSTADPQAVLTISEVQALLAPLSQGRPTRSNHRTGDLTVCSLAPMRSVPYRIICLLGMDDGVFPRSPGDDGDDVLALFPRIGTREANGEDRQLLLDALMATRDRLVIIYSGHDERTNAPRPPAVPIAELRDVINLTVASGRGERPKPSERIEIAHPLQSFAPKNFAIEGRVDQPDRRLDPHPWGFDRRMLAAAQTPRPEPGEAVPSPIPPVGTLEWEEGKLELTQLRGFLEHPVRAFIQTRLGFRYPDRAEQRSDTLPVEMTGLEQWAVGQRLLEGALAGYDRESLVRSEWGRGSLPPAKLGQRYLLSIGESVNAILAAVEAIGLALPARDSRQIEVEVAGGRRLVGLVSGLAAEKSVAVQFAQVRGKHIAAAYLRLVALSAADPATPWQAVVVGREGGKDGGVHVEILGPLGDLAAERGSEAGRRLNELIDLYERGMKEPLPLVPSASYAFAVATDPVQGFGDAKAAWENRFGNMPAEADDPHHVLAFGGPIGFAQLLALSRPDEVGADWPVAASRFETLALRLWEPIFEVRRGGT